VAQRLNGLGVEPGGRRGKLRERPERRFIFRLALALGMPVGRLLAEMPSSELTEWIAYAAIEPFGEQRADLRAGIVAAATVNSGFARPKEAVRASDFMPFIESRRGPIQLADPVEHGKLISQVLFAGMQVVDARKG
jgi:hypothetical protein